MEMLTEDVFWLLMAAVGAVAVAFLIHFIAFRRSVVHPPSLVDESSVSSSDFSEMTIKSKNLQRAQTVKAKSKAPDKHPLQAAHLKGHTGVVLSLDFSVDGKYLASCATDRTVRVWNIKDFLEKDHKYIRVNVEFDCAKSVSISPDSKAVVGSTEDGNNVRVFKLTRKKDGTGACSDVVDFPKEHNAAIISAAIASTGRFILTCYSDTTFIIWDLKGEVLAKEDTKQMQNHFACISPCGRFVACTGFTPDVKLWEVVFAKSGEFSGVTRAMDLKGHKAAVYCCAFSKDSTRAATVSKDGSWKFWNQDVQYKLQQDPHLLMTGKYKHSGPAQIGLSPDGLVAAIAAESSISLYETANGSLATTLDNVHTSPICRLVWDPLGRYFASCGGNDKHIRVWHNAPGYRAQMADCKNKIFNAKSDVLKERLRQQIKEAEQSLEAIGAQSNGI